jgi:hypothetical protein
MYSFVGRWFELIDGSPLDQAPRLIGIPGRDQQPRLDKPCEPTLQFTFQLTGYACCTQPIADNLCLAHVVRSVHDNGFFGVHDCS